MDTTRTFRPLRRLFLLAVLLPALGLSCRDATGPDQVRLYAIPGTLAIVNEGATAIYSFAVDEETLPLLDWIPRVCDECGRVNPGTTRYVDVDSIVGGGAGRVAVVFFWRATIGPDRTVVPGPISHRQVRLDPGVIN
jgi:hypothetical protein